MDARICSLVGCPNPLLARGFCSPHYARWRRNGHPGGVAVQVLGANPFCSLDGCDRPHLARGYCEAHLARYMRTGDPGSAEIRHRGQGGLCEVEDCERPTEGQGLCVMHYGRKRKTGDPLGLLPVGVGDAVTYEGAHARVKAARGRPSQHICVGCGKQAEDWAYDHRDPAGKISTGPKALRPYSPDPAHYLPMCRSCHKRYDVEHAPSYKRRRASKGDL